MKLILRMTVLFVVTIAITQFIIPSVMSSALEKNYAAKLNTSEKIEVDVNSFPALEILTGNVDNINVTAEKIAAHEIVLDKVVLKFNNIEFNPVQLISGNYRLNLNEKGEAKITISQQSLNNYLKKKQIPVIKDLKIKLNNDKIQLKGEVDFLGSRFPVEILGGLKVVENKIVVKVNEIDMGNYDFGDVFKKQLQNKISINFIFESLPYQTKLKKVTLGKRKMILDADILSKKIDKK